MNGPNRAHGKQLIALIYDGIDNSVFEGQVLQPLLKKKERFNETIIISFEKNSAFSISSSIPKDITVIIVKKYPYFGQVSLWWAIVKTRAILKQFPCYSILARGPLAGYISQLAAQKSRCQEICIQARGLLAEEYGYTTQSSKGIMKTIHTVRKWLYKRLEHKAYLISNKVPVRIEAVSSALKDYLINAYDVDSANIVIAHDDIPSLWDKEQILLLRQEIRKQLAIDKEVITFCYNGSAKAWQCPEMVIDYFKKYYEKNDQSFLLILTQDTEIFEKLLSQSKIDKKFYLIKQIDHNRVYHYLAASDYGLIFRQPHIINWTSRPTKVLEYQAVGLSIIHNNTIEILCQK